MVRLDVLAVQMPAKPSEARFYSQILAALGAPTRPSERLSAIEPIALGLLRQIRPKLLVVDEVHNLLAGSAREQRVALNLLKFLANELACAVVALGTRDAQALMQTDEQIASRFRPLELPRWRDDDSLVRFLRAFERLLPLKGALAAERAAHRPHDPGAQRRHHRRDCRDADAGCIPGDPPRRRAHHRRDPRSRVPSAAPAVRPPPFPWVVAPLPDEWLGFWLHRVVEPYGMWVLDLLNYAGAADNARAVPTWARLPAFSVRDRDALACLLHEPRASLERMQRLVSSPGRTGQAGYCQPCLANDLEVLRAPYWRRDWLDPYIGWCEIHRIRLTPIDAGELRRLTTASSIGALMASLAATPPAPGGPNGSNLQPGTSIALQGMLRDEAARLGGIGNAGEQLLRRRVDHIAHALLEELRHARPTDTQLSPLASLAPELDAPIVWSPAPMFAGLLSGVRSQRQRVSLMSAVGQVFLDKSVLDQPQQEWQRSLVRRSDQQHVGAEQRRGTDRKYSNFSASRRSVASY